MRQFITTIADLWRVWNLHPATRDHVGEAMLRFVRWQIASRLHGGPLVVPFVAPARLMMSRGQPTLTGNLYLGLMEMQEMAFLLHYLRPQDLFVDVGANYGTFCLLASKVVGARTLGFEPVQSTLAVLRDQLNLNAVADRVEIRELALGAEPGKVEFYEGLGAVNRVVAASENPFGAHREVPQSTLDIELAGAKPAMLKLDVEGYEYAILKGAAKVLAEPSLQAIVVEVHEGVHTYGVDPRQLQALLVDAGFAPYEYDAQTRRLTPGEFVTSGSKRLSDNILMLRDIEAVQARVASAPAFTVLGKSF